MNAWKNSYTCFVLQTTLVQIFLSYPDDLHKLVNVYSALDMIFILLLSFTFTYFHTLESKYFLVLTQGSKSIVICKNRIGRKFESLNRLFSEKKYGIIMYSFSFDKWLEKAYQCIKVPTSWVLPMCASTHICLDRGRVVCF